MRISISPTRPQLSNPTKSNRVLGKRRNLLGYIEVATLKRKWEAGEVNQVRISHLFIYAGSQTNAFVLVRRSDGTDGRVDSQDLVVHDHI